MLQRFLLARLVGLNDQLASGVREFHRAALALAEMVRPDLFAVDERHGQPVSQPRAKFLHQIQRQSRTVGTFDVKKTDKRVQSHRCQRRQTVVPDQGVKKGKQAIDAVARGPAAAGGKGKIAALLLEQQGKHPKISLRAHALCAAQCIQRLRRGQAFRLSSNSIRPLDIMCIQRLRRGQAFRWPAAQVLNLPSQALGGGFQAGLFRCILRLPGGAQQGIAAIL